MKNISIHKIKNCIIDYNWAPATNQLIKLRDIWFTMKIMLATQGLDQRLL